MGPACTCTTRDPEERATRCAASSTVRRSLPTTASRRPPPTDEQASSSGSAAPGAAATTARTAASTPARTSATVVGCSANPASAPSNRTRTAFVQVEPTSTQTAALASSRVTRRSLTAEGDRLPSADPARLRGDPMVAPVGHRYGRVSSAT